MIAPHRSTTRAGYNEAYRAKRRSILGPSGNGDLPQDVQCYWQGPNCTGVATEGDHDPPLSVAGPHLNLVPACRPCNAGRRHSTPARAQPSRDW